MRLASEIQYSEELNEDGRGLGLFQGVNLFLRAGDKAARDLFAYSIAHLTLLFAALLVEHGAGAYTPVMAFLGGGA